MKSTVGDSTNCGIHAVERDECTTMNSRSILLCNKSSNDLVALRKVNGMRPVAQFGILVVVDVGVSKDVHWIAVPGCGMMRKEKGTIRGIWK